ncbi:hypothetical protein [Streptomyces sp. V1I6]|uniref:hypothetical protein n=1 Tax=Streptomyces sp. V1I6 TaxID=3042273 RepID=UPI002789FBA2|nr:hypothetical protein [Streptomyces sp. V1I6]MDQ0847534.1 hypothetical protein [Streptomyces sp. V1I6]
MGLGIYGDAHLWWENRGFLTNLVSSVTSLLFGVPTALIVLVHLGDAQTEALERRKLQRRAASEASAFWELTVRHLRSTEMTELKPHLRRLAALADRMQDIYDREDPADDEARNRRDAEVEGVKEEIRATAREVMQWPDTLEAALKDFESWAAEMQAQWDLLDQEVRPRIAEMGEPWLPAQQTATTRRLASELTNPLRSRQFAELHGWLLRLDRIVQSADDLKQLYSR